MKLFNQFFYLKLIALVIDGQEALDNFAQTRLIILNVFNIVHQTLQKLILMFMIL